jgi:hypothetical protein
MDEPFIPTTNPSIEDVHQRFDQWRKIRKHRTPIPESLWEGAVSLCADHSIYKISRMLHLNYNVLKRRAHYCQPESLPAAMMPSEFVEFELKATLPESECFLEKEDKDGTKMKLHIKSRLCLDPLELMKAFLGQGR